MHEIYLVRNVFSTLESEFSKDDLAKLTAIDLKIGLLSNVEPILLQNAFSAVATTRQKYKSVLLNIELVPVEIYCNDCLSSSNIENYRFVCHKCGKPCNNVIKGTEMHIHKVHFSDQS